MDGELALAMVQRCASVLCLDVPEGTDVGLDTELWVVGPRFKGIKMIPPGQAHFFYYRCGLPPPPRSIFPSPTAACRQARVGAVPGMTHARCGAALQSG
jgi:hypothetical protein